MIQHHRKTENAHIFLWLLKDTCWVCDFKIPGLVMIFPTIVVAVYLTWKLRSDLAEFAHNTAICSWICANSVWMIGEFFYDDTTRPIALIFFATGLAIISCYYLSLLFSKKDQQSA